MSFRLYYVNTGPCQIQRFCSFSRFCLKYPTQRIYSRYLDNSIRDILHNCYQIQRTCSCLHYDNSGRGHIQWCCSTAYWEFNIPLKASKLLYVISRQFHAGSTPHMLSNTAHVIRFALWQLWALSNTALLQFWRSCLKYSIERISVSIPDTSIGRCALYSTFAAKHSAHLPAFAM